MSFNAEQKNIYDLFNRKLYIIPRNQRKYVWEKRNWEELLEDFNLVVDGMSPSHFLGSFVLKDEGRENGLPKFTIIDGQQRIITLTILLSSILFWLKKDSCNEDYEGTKQYVVAKDDKAKDTLMLVSEMHLSLDKIIKYLLESTPETIKKIAPNTFIDSNTLNGSRDKQIVAAYKYFISAIKDKKENSSNPVDYLIKLREAVVNTSYISIVSSSEEDSYTIFEILNARGIDLEDHELLKNYIMRYIQPEESRDQAKIKWLEIESCLGSNISKYVKHYATHKYSFNHITETAYKVIQKHNKGKNTLQLLDDLYLKAKYYKKLVNPILISDNGDSTLFDDSCDYIEFRIFSYFKKARLEQIRPILLSIISKYRIGCINTEEYHSILNRLYGFYVCYTIIGERDSNKLTNLVYKYSELIENNYSKEVMNDFITSMTSKLPSEDAFISSFGNVGWSHNWGFFQDDKHKGQVKNVLELLESSVNNGHCSDGYTIEHIFDDCESVENSQIGNLLLLESELNERANGKSFSEKLDIYSESNYKSTRNFAKRFKSCAFDPEKRTKYLANQIYKLIKTCGFEE